MLFRSRRGLPEAMLWYGLACRHGWGMRENKAEALQWLRRAVDSGHLEIADDEVLSKQGQTTDVMKKKQHRAQYAVAIYELGKCYMNGWGAARDKTLALRCYEIAGNWGDPDALVEAGYCYAEGVGCRKDMKKAAKFYRAAEAKGVSMVGNSWSVIPFVSFIDNVTNISTGSTKTNTMRTTPARPIPAPSAQDDQQKRTTLTRGPATRAAHVPSSAARRATRLLPLKLCSPLYMRPTIWLLHIWRRRPRISGCLFVLHIPLGRLTGPQSCLCTCHHSFACLFVTFALLSFVLVHFDTCPVHGTATLLGPKFAFIWTHSHHFLLAFGYVFAIFPLSISICT